MSGPAVNVPFLNLPAQHAPLKAAILEQMGKIFDNAGFIGGPNVTGFEEEFAAFVGSPHCVGVCSGTDALRFALTGLGVGHGDRVVTVPNTFIATTEAISQVGASIDFVDVEHDTALMDPQKLSDLLAAIFGKGPKDRRPKAIAPVHLYGQCADMTAIMELAKRYELKVLEDAAQAHGATHRGGSAGTLGHAAGFSFYPGKNLGACGEGGAVTTADPAVAETVRVLREHGQAVKNIHILEGYNGRLDAIQAAILRIKLPHLAGWNEARRAHSAKFDAAFAGVKGIRPITVKEHNVSSRHLYIVHVKNREAFRDTLAANGVGVGMHYPTPLHLQPCYKGLGLGDGSLPVAEELCSSLISLPMYPEMTQEQVQKVIDVSIKAVGSA